MLRLGAVALAIGLPVLSQANPTPDTKGPTSPSARPAEPARTTLQLVIRGFRNRNGQVLLGVYDSKQAWLNVPRALHTARLSVAGETTTYTVPDLLPGVYAVAVLHDENSNGKLDMRVLPPGPAEGTAISNDATGSFGPPDFHDARFALSEKGGVMTMRVRY